MKVRIHPGIARGTVDAPPSKSMAHRYLIAAALAEGCSEIRGVSFSQDIRATIGCLRALGVAPEIREDTVLITGGGALCPGAELPCFESGSTLRFLLPLCLLSGQPARLTGSGRLMERPLGVYETLCREQGFLFRRSAGAVEVAGKLCAGEYVIPGNISSQFVTGLIFALLRVPGESHIRLTGEIESRSYIELTLAALKDFGFSAGWTAADTLRICGGLPGTGRIIEVEGDYSNAAFLEALGTLGGSVAVLGLRADSLQGDRIYRDYFKQLESGRPALSLRDCPDLGPVLFAVAAALNGGIFTETARLKIKESDRGAAMAAELLKFGVELQIEENRILVPGGQLGTPRAILRGHNDHRIVMALAVLCTRTGGSIDGAQAVAKSMPDFFEQLKKLGIEVEIDENK